MTTQPSKQRISRNHSLGRRWCQAALLGCLGMLALESAAQAAQPFTRDTRSLAGGLQYGALIGDLGANPYGAGLGARLGFTLESDLYLGGLVEYFLGSTSSFVTDSAVQTMLEGGYDVALGPTTVVRPKLGIGLFLLDQNLDLGAGGDSSSFTDLAVAPGIQLLFAVKSVQISLEARANIVLDDLSNGLIAGAGVGTTF